MKKIFIAAGPIIALMISAVSINAQTQSREDLFRDIAAKRAELLKLQKAYLAPSEEDLAKYGDFLRLPDTGLIRLLPRENFDVGAFYSFKERTHDYVNSTAIGLERGQLITIFAGANYAMLANVGDVPLENVSLEATAAQVMAQHTPAIDEPHARLEQRRYMGGTTVDGISYKSRLPLRLNSTYVLRSVIYDTSDALVALRIVRVDNDDSAIILWKLLKKYPTPYLARN